MEAMKLQIGLFAFAVTISGCGSAMAQFGWDDEPDVGSVQTALDEFDAVRRAPVIEPIEPIDPVIDPVAAIFQPFVSPVLDADPLLKRAVAAPCSHVRWKDSV